MKVTNCHHALLQRPTFGASNEGVGTSSHSLKVSPNPAHDHINIFPASHTDAVLNYIITSTLGQVVLAGSINGADADPAEISPINLPTGLYYCSILEEGDVETCVFAITK